MLYIYIYIYIDIYIYIYIYIKFKYHPRNSESGAVNLVLVMVALSSVKLTLIGCKQRGDPVSLSTQTRTTNSEEMMQGFLVYCVLFSDISQKCS